MTSPTDDLARLRELSVEELVTCADFDEDCEGVVCKVTCWLYDPARGMCPYLRATHVKGKADE